MTAHDSCWPSLRARCPAADAFVHVNHASTSLPDQAVFDAQRTFLELEATLGMHRAVDRVGDALADVPARVARMIGTAPDRIAFVDSAARGWAHALSAVAPDALLEVFVSRQEWAANVMSVTNLARARMTVLPDPVDGDWAQVVGDALARRAPERTAVVSLPIQSSFCGEPNRLEGIAAVVRDAGGWFFVDASQAVGQAVVDMDAISADVLVFPARKWLRGPRGISVLALSARALAEDVSSTATAPGLGLPAMLDVHGTRLDASQRTLAPKAGASRFQAYDYAPALRLGLGAAVEALLAVGVGRVQTRVLEVAGALRARMAHVPGFSLADAGGSGLVCLRADVDHSALVQALWTRNINIATVGATYAPLAFDGAQSVLRLSPHVVTEPWEVDRVCDVLEREAERLQRG